MSAVPLPLLAKWPVVAVKSEKWYLQIFNGKAWKEFFKMKLLKAANPQLLLKRLVWVNFFTCADQTDTGSRRKAGGKHAQH